MGVYSGSVRFRASQDNQGSAGANQLCELGNTLTAAMLAIGMLPVLGSDFGGQAGTYVSGTAGPGETQVVPGTTSGIATFGYNVFKHPVLDLYVQVFLRDRGRATMSRIGQITYTLWRRVSGGTGAGSSLSLYPLANVSTVGDTTLTVVPASYTDLFASCGDDHFWVYNRPNHAIAANNGSGVSTTRAGLPAGVSFTGILVSAAADDPEKLLVVAPQQNQNIQTEVSGLEFGAVVEQQSVRVYGSLSPTAGWLTFKSGACCTLSHPGAESVAAGVRVSRGQLVLDGVKRNFDFGWLTAAAASDISLIELDFTGVAKNYRVAHGFGGGNHMYYSCPITDMAAMTLPWNA